MFDAEKSQTLTGQRSSSRQSSTTLLIAPLSGDAAIALSHAGYERGLAITAAINSRGFAIPPTTAELALRRFEPLERVFVNG